MESVQDDCIIPPGSLHTSNFVIIVEVSFFYQKWLIQRNLLQSLIISWKVNSIDG